MLLKTGVDYTGQAAANVLGGNVEDDALGLMGTERVHRLLAGLTPRPARPLAGS